MRRRSLPRRFWPLIMLIVALALVGRLGILRLLDSDGRYVVERVVDGDTILLAGGERVRYIGVDTPESVQPDRPVECYGGEAAQKNKELVQGKRVILERDVSDRDRFGRLLRYVYVDGLFVNGELVKSGYAKAARYPPDTKHHDALTKLQEEAKRDNLGLWGACSR